MHALIVFMTISVIVMGVYIYTLLTLIALIHARVIINNAAATTESQIIRQNDYGSNATYSLHLITPMEYMYTTNTPAAMLIENNNNTRKYI